jgi:hypothetical protein
MSVIGKNADQLRIVHTNKNTGLEAWKALCIEEFAKRGLEPIEVSALRMLHAWEGGDTPFGWVDFLVRQQAKQARMKLLKMANP